MSSNCLFEKPWWLDAVAPKKWKEIKVEKSGEVVARMPYVFEKRKGFILIKMPPLTQTLGPWLRPSKAKYAKQISEQKDLQMDLIDKIPKFDSFSLDFHYSLTNWLPFYWRGFEQTTRYTYIIEDLTDIGRVWEGLLPKIRTDIKKAKNRFKLKIRTDLGIDIFLENNEMTFRRQGIKVPYSEELLRRVDSACERESARKIFFAVDKNGRIHASAYIVWDENSAYYLMGGSDPELRSSGATSLCLWEAIDFASTVTERFDFEGSMMESVERYFRGFGAVQKPYFRIYKQESKLLGLYKNTKNVIKLFK